MTAATPRQRLLAVVALAAVPWSVLTYPGGVAFLFPWGLLNLDPPGVTPLYDYLFRYTAGLPDYILAWPVSVGCYLLALASVAVGVAAGREDVRVTAGLLVLAGLAHLSVASGFAVQPGRTGYPAGTVALWAVAAWHWPAVHARLRR